MLRHNRGSKLTCIVILAAVVAALTTVAIFLLRMRMRKKAMPCYGDSIDYDLGDCCCGCGDLEDASDNYDQEDPVQIPLADEQNNHANDGFAESEDNM